MVWTMHQIRVHVRSVHNFKNIIVVFLQLSGPIPIPPRFAFGIYYSRYWAYNDIGDMVCLLCSVLLVEHASANGYIL